MRTTMLAIFLLAAMGCHNDYYPDGHRKGSYGAYKDFDGPLEWLTYCYYQEEVTKQLSILFKLKMEGIKTKIDTFSYNIEVDMLHRDEDSLAAYKKYANKYD